MRVVNDFLHTYSRGEDELLEGERESLSFADSDYETDKHWAFEIKPEECALIVVDLQEDFVNPGNPMCVPEAYRQLPRVEALIAACRDTGVPVLYTEHTAAPDVAHDFYAFWPPIRNGAVAESTPGSKLYRRLRPRDGERVISAKHTYDSFAGTELDYALRCRGVRTLIVCGTLTNFCCESTARSAFSLGYHVVFGSDVNATDNADAQRATLRTMRRGVGRVLDHRTIIDTLHNGDSLHHAAKERPDLSAD
ncbi:isochorismatase family cysteine hydrolase [Saccharopolyspora sp. NPDC002686]|uniref:cysteine hydrolase family protein n=1 Tax=Saccharopolyspora sp. NPDC002686 TaxID=3154541 RepID=UPI00332BBD3B